MPNLAQLIEAMDLPASVKQGLQQIAAAAIGAAIGGSASVAAAVNVEANNRQLHPDEIEWIKENAKRFAKEKGISPQEAERRLAQQAFRQVQFGVPGDIDADAKAFLDTAGKQLLPGDPNVPGQNVGYMFFATPAQRANAVMYLATYPDSASFYVQNGLKQPTVPDLLQAAQRDAQIRSNISIATKTAFAASATINLIGLAPTLFNFALANPLAATQAGIISAETAAAITSGAVNPTSLAPLLSASGMKTVAKLEDAFTGSPAAATVGGYVNSSKICQLGCSISGLTTEEQSVVKLIASGQDKGGNLTEQLFESVAARTGMEVLSGGKYGANNGFDLVLKGKDGTITVILDGKQLSASGAAQLSTSGAGQTTQLSEEWIANVLDRLPKDSAARKAVADAQMNGKLITAVGGVNRNTGELVVVPVAVPNKPR